MQWIDELKLLKLMLLNLIKIHLNYKIYSYRVRKSKCWENFPARFVIPVQQIFVVFLFSCCEHPILGKYKASGFLLQPIVWVLDPSRLYDIIFINFPDIFLLIFFIQIKLSPHMIQILRPRLGKKRPETGLKVQTSSGPSVVSSLHSKVHPALGHQIFATASIHCKDKSDR